ncbi:type II secretion system protein [Hydrogenobaculum acidophilum]
MKVLPHYKGFSIIEFLLVLTAFVLFLGAAFIGYRTLRANAEENKISLRIKLFVKGINEYAKDFGVYPFINCASASDWNTAASSNNVASCSALMSYIGHWLANTNEGQTWQYYTWGNGGAQTGCYGTGTSCTVSPMQGVYTLAFPVIDNNYVWAVVNQLNSFGLTCYSSTWYQASGSTLITCTSDTIFLSPTSPKF